VNNVSLWQRQPDRELERERESTASKSPRGSRKWSWNEKGDSEPAANHFVLIVNQAANAC
jgi:hypothetical protein